MDEMFEKLQENNREALEDIRDARKDFNELAQETIEECAEYVANHVFVNGTSLVVISDDVDEWMQSRFEVG